MIHSTLQETEIRTVLSNIAFSRQSGLAMYEYALGGGTDTSLWGLSSMDVQRVMSIYHHVLCLVKGQ